MEVLSSRILLRPADLAASRHFCRDVLGLVVYRQFGTPGDPGMAFFLGTGFREVSGHSDGGAGRTAQPGSWTENTVSLLWRAYTDLRTARLPRMPHRRTSRAD